MRRKHRSKRASYREAVAWIAHNDEAGSDDALAPEWVSVYVTVGLVADIFRKNQETVAADVIRYRHKHTISIERRGEPQRGARSGGVLL